MQQDLKCPNCSCFILKKHVGTLLNSIETSVPCPFPLPVSQLISLESMYQFENIGFLKSDPNQKHIDVRYLICADCDYGPLGYQVNQELVIASF
jgi:hypothetical protein